MPKEVAAQISEQAISSGLVGSSWLPFLVLLLSALGGFLGAYLKKKGEHFATREDFEQLLLQTKITTQETESIKTEIARNSWLHQRVWGLKEKYYSNLLQELFELKYVLSEMDTYYMQPGPEHQDASINEQGHYKKLSARLATALENIHKLQGPSQIVISQKSSHALQEIYKEQWNASNFSVCNSEYLSQMYPIVENAYSIVLAEARQELQ